MALLSVIFEYGYNIAFASAKYNAEQVQYMSCLQKNDTLPCVYMIYIKGVPQKNKAFVGLFDRYVI